MIQILQCSLIPFQQILLDKGCYSCPLKYYNKVFVYGDVKIMCVQDFQYVQQFEIQGSITILNFYHKFGIYIKQGSIQFHILNNLIMNITTSDLVFLRAQNILFSSTKSNNIQNISTKLIRVVNTCLIVKELYTYEGYFVSTEVNISSIYADHLIIDDESKVYSTMINTRSILLHGFISSSIYSNQVNISYNGQIVSSNIIIHELFMNNNSSLSSIFITINSKIQLLDLAKIDCTKGVFSNFISQYNNLVNCDLIFIKYFVQSTGVVISNDLYLSDVINGSIKHQFIYNFTTINSDVNITTIQQAYSNYTVINSSIYANQIYTDFLYCQNSSISVKYMNIQENIEVKQYSQILVEHTSNLRNAYFSKDSQFTTSILIIQSKNQETKLYIPSIILPNIQLSQYYETIIHSIAKENLLSPQFKQGIEEILEQNGTIFISDNVYLFSEFIQASAIISYGKLLDQKSNPGYQSSLTLSIFYLFCQLTTKNHIFSHLEVVNSEPNSVAFIRIPKSLLLMKLTVKGTTLYINQNQMSLNFLETFGLTVFIQLLVYEDSKIIGDISFTCSSIQFLQLYLVQGPLILYEHKIQQGKYGIIHVQKIIINRPDLNVTLLGQVFSMTQDVFNPSIDINANLINLNIIQASNNKSYSKGLDCCGGSHVNFGGCSYGQAKQLINNKTLFSPIQGYSGDSCNKFRGGNGGGVILLKAIKVYFQELIVSGESTNYCAGGGAGGYISIQGDAKGYSVNADGGDSPCGAGSAGKIVGFDEVPQNGNSKFKTISPESYCPFYSYLDGDFQQCKISLFSGLIILVISSILISIFW